MWRSTIIGVLATTSIVLLTSCAADVQAPAQVASPQVLPTQVSGAVTATPEVAQESATAPIASTPTVVVAPTILPNTPTAQPIPTSTPSPPPVPLVNSTTNPDPKAWLDVKDVVFTWSMPNSIEIKGFGYVVDQEPSAEAPKELSTMETQVSIGDLQDGTWYFHVRALGTSGLWGPTATRRVNIDRAGLSVDVPKFSSFVFNPRFFKQNFWFDVSRPADVTVAIQTDGGQLLRTISAPQPDAGEVDLSWDGKDDRGAFVPAGNIVFNVVAEDSHGHRATSSATGLGVTYDRMLISLSKQSLTAMEGDNALFSTLVTTGNPELPTPVGVFPVLAKLRGFVFHSPWPKGSPFWYKDSPTTYAMLFDNTGYFVHDAPWRRRFGPGTNTERGTPGQDLTGTHGCVNVPFDAAARLFNWAPTGAVVQVVP